MPDNEKPDLPPGVDLTVSAGDEPIQLTVRAADVNELAWRIHDLIPLIQSGQLARLVDAARKTGPAKTQASPRPVD